MGLSTVYGIVKQHGGAIWVYSEPDHGTIFKIFFPITQTKEILDKKRVETELLPAAGETIMVVEDEEKLRMFICSALTKSGYMVLSAGSPLEAQAIEKQHKGLIHLMLTDVVMPEMNGKVLSEIFAPSRPEMKVLFMSGYTENVIAERGVLKEGINFIQKPFAINELRSKLGAILSREDEIFS